MLLMACQGRVENTSSTRDAYIEVENDALLAALVGFFDLTSKPSTQLHGGIAIGAEEANTNYPSEDLGCQLFVEKFSEPEGGVGKGFLVRLQTKSSVAEAKPKALEFKLWNFAPDQRVWSRHRTVGSDLSVPANLREFGGSGLSAQVVHYDFDQKNLLLTQKSVKQSINLRRFPSGSLEVTLKNIDAGVLPHLLTSPSTASCRFNNASA